ncbi:hypothetical protein PSEUDO8AS_30152 [Pseudomonas sp. 8AS]|nr:hypothetical protein PSEUDO8AS_30152 [Pseudomonas sp. 8AS]
MHIPFYAVLRWLSPSGPEMPDFPFDLKLNFLKILLHLTSEILYFFFAELPLISHESFVSYLDYLTLGTLPINA